VPIVLVAPSELLAELCNVRGGGDATFELGSDRQLLERDSAQEVVET
jgi:hypothetical protein